MCSNPNSQRDDGNGVSKKSGLTGHVARRAKKTRTAVDQKLTTPTHNEQQRKKEKKRKRKKNKKKRRKRGRKKEREGEREKMTKQLGGVCTAPRHLIYDAS